MFRIRAHNDGAVLPATDDGLDSRSGSWLPKPITSPTGAANNDSTPHSTCSAKRLSPLIDGDPNALPGIDRCRRCAGPGERSRLVGSPRVVVAAEPDPLLCIPGDRIGWTVWFIAGTASTTKLDTTRERRVRHLGRGPSRSRSCSVAAPWDVDKGRSGLRTDEHKVAGQRADRY